MKNILITGASSGLGEEFAFQYASVDTRLFLTGRDHSRLRDIAEKCRQKGAEVRERSIDVCDQPAMKDWIQSENRAYGAFDLVIANAGISGGFNGQSIDDITHDGRIFDVNLTGVLNTIYPALPDMISRKSGHIVFISSLAGFIPMPSAPAYSASKAAVRFYGEALISKLNPHNIAVSIICPGFIVSRMTDANTFPMPFLMRTDKAVTHMIKRIAQKKTRIDFPWQMAISLKLLSLLPSFVTHAFFAYLPDKKLLPKG